jgi:curved DNA-binding protein CbpA
MNHRTLLNEAHHNPGWLHHCLRGGGRHFCDALLLLVTTGRKSMNDPYATLGVSRAATNDEVKRAYRKRAKKAHPDRKGGDHEEMTQLNRAYALLADPAKRAAYDAGDDPDRPSKSLDEEAQELLVGAMEAAFNQLTEDDDLVAAVRAMLNAASAEQERNAGNAERRAKKAATVLARLKGGELFRPMLERQAASAEREATNARRTVERLQRAMTLAQAVRWEGPTPSRGVSIRMGGWRTA